MLTEQRHEIILNLLSEKGSITVTELKDILNTSESTIRRDLNTLDEQGRLTKVFGGAVEKINGVSTTELSVSQKADVNTEEKKKIAMYAARLVVPNDFIYIDAGTTTEYLIDYLEEKTATYVTNAVTHARKLAIAGFKVILIGGELKGITEAVVGNQAIITIDRMNFNKGFFGTNGITEKSGFTTPDINEALVKETAFAHCHFKYILTDSSKFGETSAVTFGSINEATIITDKKIGSFAKLPKHNNSIIISNIIARWQ